MISNSLPFFHPYVSVGTRSATNRSSVGFAREWAQTISFVESGFERLGRGYPTVVLLWNSCMVQVYSPLESFSFGQIGAPLPDCLLFLLY